MERKIVKVQDPSIVMFLYPSYKVKSELTLMDMDEDIIYTGPVKRNLKDYLSSRTRNFISLVGQPDLDLSDNRALLKWAVEKKGKKLSDSVYESVSVMDEVQFFETFKIYWVLGRWVAGTEDTEVSTYDLFKHSSGALKDLIQTSFKLVDTMAFPVLEASYLTFLQRVKAVDEQNVNPSYMRVLKSASVKIGPRINRSIVAYATRKGLREDLHFLSLILSLR